MTNEKGAVLKSGGVFLYVPKDLKQSVVKSGVFSIFYSGGGAKWSDSNMTVLFYRTYRPKTETKNRLSEANLRLNVCF